MIYNLAQSFNFTFQMMLCIDNGREITIAETTKTAINCLVFFAYYVISRIKENNPVKKTLTQ